MAAEVIGLVCSSLSSQLSTIKVTGGLLTEGLFPANVPSSLAMDKHRKSSPQPSETSVHSSWWGLLQGHYDWSLE